MDKCSTTMLVICIFLHGGLISTLQILFAFPYTLDGQLTTLSTMMLRDPSASSFRLLLSCSLSLLSDVQSSIHIVVS